MFTYYGSGKAAALRRAVHELLLEHEAADELPTSNRFLFYELRQRGGPLYGHSSRGQGRSQDQNLYDASTFLRNEGSSPGTGSSTRRARSPSGSTPRRSPSTSPARSTTPAGATTSRRS
jgi:hypothetical protein